MLGKKVAEKTSWTEKTQQEKKVSTPMNHMIDVASYWACVCQKTADLRHLRRSALDPIGRSPFLPL